MGLEGLEETLAQITELGTAIKVRPYREVWRFSHRGRAYYLKWFPRAGTEAKRLVRGNPAQREYERLLQLQKAGVPSPRATALLSGLVLKGRKGDGVMTDALEPGEALDQLLYRDKQPPQGHRALVREVIALVQKLAKGGMGHSDLHFGNFLAHQGKLHLLDAYAVHGGGLSLTDLEVLGHSAASTATRTDLLRGWRALGTGGTLPPIATKVARRAWRKTVERMTAETEYAGRFESGAGGEVGGAGG